VKLLEGEELVWQGRPSWRSMLAFYLEWGFFALLPVIVVSVAKGVGNADWPIWIGIVLTLVLVAIVLVIGWVRRLMTLYTVTSQRLLIRRGILSRKEQAAHIDRVQNVSTTQNLLQRLLRVGNVDFDTAGSADFDFRFAGVNAPRDLREIIAKAYGERPREPETEKPA
jgi:uncharacterized membrane protein YdbT with pleckstrin-like domain